MLPFKCPNVASDTTRNTALRTRSIPLLAAAGGALAALSLPPFHLWFLGPVGYAVLAGTLVNAPTKGRLTRAFAFYVAFFVVGLAWMIEFTGPGAVLLILFESALTTAAVVVLPRSRRACLMALPAVVMLGEAFRYRFPFGGLPMASPALGQVDGPLLPLARVAGDFSLVFMAVAFGSVLYAILAGWRTKHPGIRRTGVLVGVFLTLICLAAGVFVHAPRAAEPIRVAYVQGGGVRGLRAVNNDVTDVYDNQLAANRRVKTPVDLIVWPEDVIDLPGPITKDPVRQQVGAIAAKFDATVVAGVVEDFRDDKFKNAAVVWDRSGKIIDRYDKVHRVPFGEYVPFRSLVSKLGDFSAVPRDAYPGQGPGLVFTRHGEIGIVISYEVFFADRARAAINAGGEILLVPTNASSFKGRQVPAQEVGAARLRAVEVGRDTVQAAPTGHSAFVTANGKTSKVSKLGAAAVGRKTMHRRHGATPFDRYGDRPMIALMLFVLVAAAALDRSVKATL